MYVPSEWMMVSQSESSPIHQILTLLETHREIRDNKEWPRAEFPDDEAFEDAQTFISGLPLELIPKPEIETADDGEISLVWQNEEYYIGLGFYGSGTFSYFADTKSGKKMDYDGVPLSDGLPKAIIDLLTTV